MKTPSQLRDRARAFAAPVAVLAFLLLPMMAGAQHRGGHGSHGGGHGGNRGHGSHGGQGGGHRGHGGHGGGHHGGGHQGGAHPRGGHQGGGQLHGSRQHHRGSHLGGSRHHHRGGHLGGHLSFYSFYGYPYSYPYSYPYDYPRYYPYDDPSYYPYDDSSYDPYDDSYYRGYDDSYGSYRPEPDLRQESGWLQIDVVPADASVYLDGRFVGTGEDLAQGLAIDPGSHVLEAVLPGRRSARWSFEVAPGGEVEDRIELERP